MTTADAARALGITPVTVRAHINGGVIAAVKRGRDWHIEAAEVARYAVERRAAHRPKKERGHNE